MSGRPFQKGHKKVGGRVAGTPNKATVAAAKMVKKDDHESIIDGVVRKAKAGDAFYEAMFLRYLRPKAQTFLGPILDYVAPTNAEEALRNVAMLGERLARGEISAELHEALLSGLRVYLGITAAEKFGAGNAQRFVVIEGNTNVDLPLPQSDASMASRPALMVVPSGKGL
jgi:hypothetical protein